jgi:UDP-N-acetylmuramate dehydrogenase
MGLIVENNRSLADFISWIKSVGIDYQENVEIKKISQIKAGGIFELMIKPSSEDQLSHAIQKMQLQKLPYKVIGNLSNVLFRDGAIKTVAISLRNMRSQVIDINEELSVGAGVLLPSIARQLVRDGYKGFAGLVGVPGCIGGAVFMNASCYGDCISDHLIDVKCIDSEGNLHIINKSNMNFSWRHSILHDLLSGWIVISARFRLEKQDGFEDSMREHQIKSHRRYYQESKYPNLGSTFATTNIYGDLAVKFIGYRVGLLFIRAISKFMFGDRHLRYANLARRFTMSYFRSFGTLRVDYSKCTFNCVVNKGGATANEIIKFVEATQRALGYSVQIEIEIQKDIQ